jgi:hypothetical protein
MKKTNETDSLNEMIVSQQQQYDTDLRLLKEQLHIAYESVKPINFVKNLVHDITSSSEIKDDLASKAIGIGTGLLTKKLLMGSSHNPITKILGTVFEFVIANKVAKNTIGIKAIGQSLWKNLFQKKPNRNQY